MCRLVITKPARGNYDCDTMRLDGWTVGTVEELLDVIRKHRLSTNGRVTCRGYDYDDFPYSHDKWRVDIKGSEVVQDVPPEILSKRVTVDFVTGSWGWNDFFVKEQK